MMMAVRCLVALLMAEVWLAVTVLATLFLAFGNFVVAWQSFAAQGYEQVPLRQIPFLGVWAEGVGLGDPPLAALYALVLTFAMNLTIITSAKMFAYMIGRYFDRRQLLRSSDPAARTGAADCLDKMLETGVWFVPMVGLTIAVILFDVAQFDLRYNMIFRDFPEVGELLEWAPEAAGRLGEFLARFVATAVWGYVGCVVGVAGAMEYAFARAGDRWRTFENAIEHAIRREDARQEQPTVQEQGTAVDAGRQEHQAPEPAPVQATPLPMKGGADEARQSSPPRNPEPVAAPPASPPPPPAAPPSAGPEVEVIVGPGEIRRFPLAEMEAHPDRFVRDGSGRAWFSRAYYEQAVMGRETPKEGKP